MHPNPVLLPQDMTLLHLPHDRYRTDRITGVFAVPLRETTAAGYALLPGLLTRGCRQLPTMAALNQQLDSLYGATVRGEVFRLGEWQVLTFSIRYLNRRYTPDGTDLTEDCTRLLLDLLFDPVLEDGAFPKDMFAQEQRCLLERLQSEMNNKRLYARQRCQEVLCPDHPFSLNPDGTIETVQAATPVTVAAAREQLLAEARIHWLYQSKEAPEAFTRTLRQRFGTLPYRRPAQLTTDTSFTIKESEVTERMPVNQAKLVLGFRIAVTEPDGPVMAARLMNALLGGSPSSLLFTHVREEKSLCYYCASTYDRHQGVLLIDSGVQPENAEQAKEEILRQLEAIQQGDFSDEELEAARRSLIQHFASYADTCSALGSFYVSQTLYDTYLSPEQTGSRLLEVTREEVCRAARLTHFDTTYLLLPEEEVPS